VGGFSHVIDLAGCGGGLVILKQNDANMRNANPEMTLERNQRHWKNRHN